MTKNSIGWLSVRLLTENTYDENDVDVDVDAVVDRLPSPIHTMKNIDKHYRMSTTAFKDSGHLPRSLHSFFSRAVLAVSASTDPLSSLFRLSSSRN
jgi:hypothetical protein